MFYAFLLSALLTVSYCKCPDSFVSIPQSERCIKVYGEKQSFNRALAFCKTQGGSLASIHSAKENEVIFESAKEFGTSPVWIGLLRSNGKAVWDDGTTVDFTNWREGYPVNASECTSMNMDTGSGQSKWQNDGKCETEKHFVCEFPALAQSDHCQWNVAADIYLFIDAVESNKKYIDSITEFGLNFYSRLNIGSGENQIQSVVNTIYTKSIRPGSLSLWCNDPSNDINKIAIKDGTLEINYTVSLNTVLKAVQKPAFGGRVNVAKYVMYYTSHDMGSDDTENTLISANLLKERGLKIFVIFFGQKPNEDSDIAKIADQLLVVDEINSVKSVVQQLWAILCREAGLISSGVLPAEPDMSTISQYDLVVVRDNSAFLDSFTYLEVSSGILKLINGLNSDYQKFGLIYVSDTAKVISRIDAVCKNMTIKAFSSSNQDSSTAVNFASAIPFITVQGLAGIRLRSDIPLRILFITTSSEPQVGLTEALDGLRSEHPSMEIGAVPISKQIPPSVNSTVDCIFVGEPGRIDQQFDKVGRWLGGSFACK